MQVPHAPADLRLGTSNYNYDMVKGKANLLIQNFRKGSDNAISPLVSIARYEKLFLKSKGTSM